MSFWDSRGPSSDCDIQELEADGASRLCNTAISDLRDAKQFCKCARFFPAGVVVRCRSSLISDSRSSKEASLDEHSDFGDVHLDRDVDWRPEDDFAALVLSRSICSRLFFNAIFISCT